MRKQLLVGLIALIACTGANAAIVFFANLNPSEEIGTLAPSGPTATPVDPAGFAKPFLSTAGGTRLPSFGTAIFVLNDAQTALSMTATIFNIDVSGLQTPLDINDDLTAAHIHSGNLFTVDSRGVAARAVTWGFFGAPDNDNNPSDLVVTPFASGVGGTFTSVWDLAEGQPGSGGLAGQLPRLIDGLGYLNFHTIQFGAGEIRGTLRVLPEPRSLALVAVAFAFAGIYIRQSRRHRR